MLGSYSSKVRLRLDGKAYAPQDSLPLSAVFSYLDSCGNPVDVMGLHNMCVEWDPLSEWERQELGTTDG
jgi:hypothetical protein